MQIFNDSNRNALRPWFAVAVVLLFCAGLIGLSLFHPYIMAAALCICIALLAMHCFPLIALCILVFIYPIGTPNFLLTLASGNQIVLSLVDFFAVLLAVLLLVRLLIGRHKNSSSNIRHNPITFRWLILAVIVFIAWGLFLTVFRSERPVIAVYGLYRMVVVFITIAYIVIHVKSQQRLVTVMAFHCGAALLYALAALYATHYVFQGTVSVISFHGASISLNYGLFNMAAGTEISLAGLMPGFGFCAKHDLSMLMLSSSFFAIYFIVRSRRPLARLALAALILLYITILFQAFSKLTMLGSFLTISILILTVKPLRRSALMIFCIFLLINVAGLYVSIKVRPSFTKTTASTSARLQEISSKSRYDASSLTGRIWIWERTIDKIIQSKGLGIGPDGLSYDVAYGYPTGHNILLTLAAEYGFPGLIIFVMVLTALGQHACRKVLCRPRTDDTAWLLQLVILAAALAALIEYSFDMPIYRQQLWHMLALLAAALSLTPDRLISNKSSAVPFAGLTPETQRFRIEN